MAHLPEDLVNGYAFASDFTPKEVIDLRDLSGYGDEHSVGVWQSVIDQSLASVGVRDATEKLVGVGFLAGNVRHAMLCDMVVDAAHRGYGIGRAILNRSINIADKARVDNLYTERLDREDLIMNRAYYESLGFLAIGDGTFVRTVASVLNWNYNHLVEDTGAKIYDLATGQERTTPDDEADPEAEVQDDNIAWVRNYFAGIVDKIPPAPAPAPEPNFQEFMDRFDRSIALRGADKL